ncbi:hypothetical protein IC229_15630 [Spirosoma sp. BT702]|uniref:PASTA domain-containing protein n=1 Tax=Spirosoma profusum TaxID=2771354 RepID=A0A926Y3R1_9BACT|nr:hypothetical protein [Spirosoma profusum]MBD2702081.1 hypothetical protein [Spirosoma profusum]
MNFFVKSIRYAATTVLCVGLLLITSCHPDDTIPAASTVKLDETDVVLKKILALGFKKSDVVDKGDYWVVQGDIKFDKPKKSKNAKKSQTLVDFTPLVSSWHAPNVAVTVDHSFPNET